LSRPAQASLLLRPITSITAHRIAQQPKAAFVAGLRPSQLPGRAACQLPDQSTIIRVRSSLTDSSRPRGARSLASFLARLPDVCFSPDSGVIADMLQPPLGARSGHPDTQRDRVCLRPDVARAASAARCVDTEDDQNERKRVEHPARMTTARRPKVAEGAIQVGAADEQARRQPCLLL